MIQNKCKVSFVIQYDRNVILYAQQCQGHGIGHKALG